MRGLRTVPACILLVVFLVAMVNAARAEVSPGDVIDKTNWEKVRGFLPDPVLEWVKKGDFILDVEVPNFELADCFPPFQIRAFETNVGKYELDANGGIIDAKSGQAADKIVGLPFPKIAVDDPGVAEKLMHNNHFLGFLSGSVQIYFQSVYLNRSGYVREGCLLGMQMPMVGHPGAVKIPNPRRMEKCSLGIIETPYDAAGTALMTWRYLDPNKQDNSFGYSPAIRRVRRMSAGNRSDALWGSDFAVDDSGGFDGKVTAFTYKFLRKQEALLPILDVDPTRIVRNDRGEWETTSGIKPVIYGYQKEGWQGAAWAPTNLCWIKRWVYVLEMHSKDRYYNYGKQHLWISADTYACTYKVIHDRAGDYWKTIFIAGVPCESDDKSMRFLTRASQQMIDDRRDRSGILRDCTPQNIWTFFAKLDPNYFTLAGFQKLCK